MTQTEYATIDGGLHFVQPKQYNFVPLDDMTPVEAAWIAHLFACSVGQHYYPDSHPQWEAIKRHFVEVKT